MSNEHYSTTPGAAEADALLNNIIGNKESAADTSIPEAVPVEPKLTIEDRARKHGWVPQDEWVSKGNDPDDWHDARTHVNNLKFFDKIENQGKTIAKLNGMIESMSATLKRADERAYQQALSDLEAQKARAVNQRDFQQYERTLNEINTLKQDAPKPANPDQEYADRVRATDYYKRFEAQNQWVLQSDPLSLAKQQFATAIGQGYKQNNPHATDEQFLEFVSAEIARNFPSVHSNAPVSKAVSGRIDGSAPSQGNGGSLDYNRLTRDEKNMINYFKRNNDAEGLKHYVSALSQDQNSRR